MKDFKEMFKSLNDFRKEDPKGFYGSIAFMVCLSIFLYLGLWFAAIVEGRV